MFLVMDHSTAPEPDDVERGFINPDAIIHLKLDDAVADLVKRIRFSLGYEIDPEDLDRPEPELPPEFLSEIDAWRAAHAADQPLKTLSYQTADYTHTMLKAAA